MPRRLQFSLANVLLVITSIALAIGWWSTVEPPTVMKRTDHPPSAEAIRTLPLTIVLFEDSGRIGHWYFSVNSGGDGELTILHGLSDVIQHVKVTDKELRELREVLIQEQFFALSDEYGDLVPDGSTQTLTISVGEWTKTVRIYFLGNWLMSNDTQRLLEPARALRAWMLIRGWFSHPQASDSRVYDQRVLDAVSAASEGN